MAPDTSARAHPRISVSSICFQNWNFEQDIEFIAGIGAPLVGILLDKIADDPKQARTMLDAAGLKPACVVAAMESVCLFGPEPADELPALKRLRPGIDACEILGSPLCYFTAGSTPLRMPADEAFDSLVAALPPAVEYARERGIRLAIEAVGTPIHQLGFIHQTQDAIDLSIAADIDVILEFQNCWMERHLKRVFAQHAHRFSLVQVSDYLVGEPQRKNRRVPGEGSIPLEWMLGLLLDAGYANPFEIEVMGPAVEAEGYESAIGRSIDWLSERLTKWGV